MRLPWIRRKPRVAVLVVSGDLEPQYSLTTVVTDQLTSLAQAGYAARLVALEGFVGTPPRGVDVRACIPRETLVDYQLGVAEAPEFESQVRRIARAIHDHLRDVDVCITHDLMFQTWFLPHNAAVRRVGARLPALRWLHWVHSAPSERPDGVGYPHVLRFSGMDNARLVYLNHCDAPRLAAMYAVPESDVCVAYNSRDPRSFFAFSPLTTALVERHGLLDADIVAVYPTRLSPGKQPAVAIKLVGALKRLGRTVCLVFCNSYSNGPDEKRYIQRLRGIAETAGLEQNELVFTSACGREYELGVPPAVVRELFQVGNVMILPSLSEACSLVLLEAALTKNLLVLNEDFPAMPEFVGPNALYFKFSSTRRTTTYHPDEAAYFTECAQRIVAELAGDKALGAFTRVKQTFNRDWIFRQQIEPLLRGDSARRDLSSGGGASVNGLASASVTEGSSPAARRAEVDPSGCHRVR